MLVSLHCVDVNYPVLSRRARVSKSGYKMPIGNSALLQVNKILYISISFSSMTLGSLLFILPSMIVLVVVYLRFIFRALLKVLIRIRIANSWMLAKDANLVKLYITALT